MRIAKEYSSFIHQIFVCPPFDHGKKKKSKNFSLDFSCYLYAKWKQNGVTIVGKRGQGNQLHQLSGPCGMYMNDNQTIYIADSENRCIIEWKVNNQVYSIVLKVYYWIEKELCMLRITEIIEIQINCSAFPYNQSSLRTFSSQFSYFQFVSWNVFVVLKVSRTKVISFSIEFYCLSCSGCELFESIFSHEKQQHHQIH